MSSLITRRSLVTNLVGIIAAPAIVRASSLMPVKAIPEEFRLYEGEIVLGLVTVSYKILYTDLAQVKSEGLPCLSPA